MQYQTPKHVIRKRPLIADTAELDPVLRVRLDAQRRREDELSDRGAEA